MKDSFYSWVNDMLIWGEKVKAMREFRFTVIKSRAIGCSTTIRKPVNLDMAKFITEGHKKLES